MPWGGEALAGDWAPELLRFVKRTRRWPKVVGQIQQDAAKNRDRVARVADRDRRGLQVDPEDRQLVASRASAVEKCRAIRQRALQSGEVVQA